jgi:hypothetical protein
VFDELDEDAPDDRIEQSKKHFLPNLILDREWVLRVSNELSGHAYR